MNYNGYTSSTAGHAYEIRYYWYDARSTSVWNDNVTYEVPFPPRTLPRRRFQNRLIDSLYPDNRPRRMAHAVPPGAPPVSLELCSETVRRSPRCPVTPQRPFVLARPRRHDRETTCIRARRKLRTWERP